MKHKRIQEKRNKWIAMLLLLCLFYGDAQAYVPYIRYAMQKERIVRDVSADAALNKCCSHHSADGCSLGECRKNHSGVLATDEVTPHTRMLSSASGAWDVPLSEGAAPWLSSAAQTAFSAADASHSHIPTSVQVDTTKDVGEIPYQSGTTPTGGVTYSVPIEVAPGRGNLKPELSITYNSQSGNDALGYGWSIGGLSAISKVSKNLYYNSTVAPVSLSTGDALMLDGMRLLPTGVANQFEPERGNMRITGNVYNGDYRSFTVEYPNGMVGTYGFPTGTVKQLAFPITRLTDALGNYMDFTYEQVDNRYYVTKISYGAHTSSPTHLAEVVFTYASRPDVTFGYEGGKEIKTSRLLNKIECKNGSELLHTYAFTYETGGGVSLLKNIGCDNLNPLQFYYGYADNTEGNVVYDIVQLPSGFSGEDVVTFKCKLNASLDEDALIIYPATNPTALSTNGKYYYSAFRADQPLLVIKSLMETDSNLVDYPIPAGPGFQTLLAADVDGIIGDDIIKINNTASGNTETLTVDFYSSNTTYYLQKVNGKTFTYNSTAFTGGSIWPKRFLTGDFLGNGKAQLFAITIDKPLDKANVHSSAYLFDAYNGITRYTGKPFNYDKYDELFAADVNGDGKTEICHIHQNGMDVYAFSADATLTKLFTISEINRKLLSLRKFLVGDVNGDGKCDVVISPELSYYREVSREVHAGAYETCFDCFALYPYEYCPQCHKYVGHSNSCIQCGEGLENGACPKHGELFWITETEFFNNGRVWTVYYGNGTGFTKKETGSVCTYEFSKNFYLQDIDSDGTADLIIGYNKWESYTTSLGYYLSKEGAFSKYGYMPFAGNELQIVPSDIAIPNYYNVLLGIKNDKLYRINYTKNESKQRFLTGMVNSLGVVQQNYYMRLNEEDPAVSEYFYKKGTSMSYPYNDYIGPFWALARQKVYADNVRVSDLAYQYEEAVMHRQGLGFRGFRKIHTEDWLRYAETLVRTYNPLQYGIPVSVESDEAKETYTYNVSVASNKKLTANLMSKASENKLTGVDALTTYDGYDEFGNCGLEVTSYFDQTSSENYVEGNMQLFSNQTTAGHYLIGLPIMQMKGTIRGNDRSQSRKWITYQAHTGLPLKQIAYMDMASGDSLKIGESHYTYNAYGNVLTKKQTSYNSTNFLGDTYTYDANGRYLSTVTDALGRTTTYNTYNKWGKPASATNYLGKQTTYAYDASGRNTMTIAPDGTTQSVSYIWNPGKGLYGTIKSATGAPDEMTCYDALKREVRTGNQRFNGDWQYIDKEYDTYGRLQRVSMPFTGSTATKWNTYGYDSHDRIVRLSEASGKVTTYSYSGNSVTTTEKGISTIRTKDTSGQRIKVSDPSGEAVYAYRADGQLKSITAPGGVVTSFEYDVYGRKTKIVDPSAGTQTSSETNYSDGSYTMSQTDAKGLTTTANYDAYGRVVSVTRPEFNTSYTYDDTTKKLLSEISTNGTKKEYTYDAYGRLSTEKETVDNVWLQKSYTYAEGNISKVSYSSSKEGSIGEENLLYANGSLNEVKLGNTSVWKLTAENELGQPTQAMTGVLARTYGYTEFGLPTLRKAGNLQHFTYNFDANTGNLLSRTDATRNLTENFTYDGLNRLTGYGTKTVTYADNGNITAKSDAGNLSYTHVSKPYAVTGAGATGINQTFAYNASGDRIEKDNLIQQRVQDITYNSLMRPETLTENGNVATFLYDASGDRKKMTITRNGTTSQTKYYLGDRYETDDTQSLLYIDGNAYSSPIVYVKEGGQWKIYYICRDYLGSITHLANADGSLAQELSYDAWGRLRNPATQEVYGESSQPTLKLGRGYTGHEHLSLFGLVNMNARLYDPVLGRFLSPDPYVQMPDNLQNLNRYSYCLNNPLCYVDENGEFWWLVIGALIGAAVNVVTHWDAIQEGGWGTGLGYAFVGGVSGALGGVVAPAVATSIGISGIVGGAIVGGTVGLTSGFTTGTGNTLVEGGGIGDALSNGVQGAIGGAVGGIVAGGIMGGAASWTKGENIWTGKPTQPVPDIRPRPANVEPDPLPKQVVPDGNNFNNDVRNYSVTTYEGHQVNPMMEGKELILRPTKINGYNSRVLQQTDIYHDYPYCFDEQILKGGWVYGTSGNSTMIVAPGSVNGVNGIYTLGINTDKGIIYHRAFYEWSKFQKDFKFPYFK